MRFLLAVLQSGFLCVAGALVLLFGVAGVVIVAGTDDGPAALVLWVGVAGAAVAGVSLLARGVSCVEGAERAIARAEVLADGERLERIDQALAELLEAVVRARLDTLVVHYRAMVGTTGVAPDGPWPRALDRFYEGVVVPHVLDALPEQRFQEVLLACGGPSDRSAGVTDPVFKAHALRWIEAHVRRASTCRAQADPASDR